VTAEHDHSFYHPKPTQYVNATLLRHGYLSPTPLRPSIAVSLQLLDVLAAVQRRGPAVSIQIMAKAFCDLRNVSINYLVEPTPLIYC
jgi:hypothetical protein